MNNAGHCALKLGQAEEARGFFERAVAADPERAEPRYNLGLVLEKLGREAEAIAAFRDAARVDSNHALSRWELAMRSSNGGRVEEALALLGEVTSLEPKLAKAWVLKARIEAALGRKDEARRSLETARSLVYRIAWCKDQGRPLNHLEAAVAKLYIGDWSLGPANDAVTLHGGYGYCHEYDMERVLRDSRLAPIGGGTSEVQRLLISRLM